MDSKPNKKQHGISEFICALKSFSTRRINAIENTKLDIWQSRFYDHIILDEIELQNIRQYIINNPLNWNDDENYSKR